MPLGQEVYLFAALIRQVHINLVETVTGYVLQT